MDNSRREQLRGLGMTNEQIEQIISMTVNKEKDVETLQVKEAPQIVKPINDQVKQYSEELNITTLADLQGYARGQVVRFPDFAEGQPFVARVRRPSMLVLAKEGKIPNSLLKSATDLFTKGGNSMANDENTLSEVYNICEIVAKATLIEPTFEEIESAGLTLADNQIMAIFNYSQNGVKALESFR